MGKIRRFLGLLSVFCMAIFISASGAFGKCYWVNLYPDGGTIQVKKRNSRAVDNEFTVATTFSYIAGEGPAKDTNAFYSRCTSNRNSCNNTLYMGDECKGEQVDVTIVPPKDKQDWALYGYDDGFYGFVDSSSATARNNLKSVNLDSYGRRLIGAFVREDFIHPVWVASALCAPGKFMVADDMECKSNCIGEEFDGWYCPGGYYPSPASSEAGTELCPDGYPHSDYNSLLTSEEQCYAMIPAGYYFTGYDEDTGTVKKAACASMDEHKVYYGAKAESCECPANSPYNDQTVK